MTTPHPQTFNLKDITADCLGTEIKTYGRLHKIRATGSVCFLILRDQIHSIQCLVHKKTDPDRFRQYCKMVPESFVVVTGIVSRLPDEVKRVEYTSHKDFEMKISHVEVVSESDPTFPFTLEDVNELYGTKDRSTVSLHHRLDHRAFDLRAPFNHSIFRLQSAVGNLYREYLCGLDFMEIHTPKIIGTSSEGGANVFKVDYFGVPVSLAQSPQLYKQMCINSDFNRVFEVGPVFRAENCVSRRHLCEFVGMDAELAITPGNTYHEVIQTLWGTLTHIFDQLPTICRDHIAYIRKIYQYPELVYPKDPLIIDFRDGVRMLREAGHEQGDLEDLTTENEKRLGDLVKERYGSDLFVLDKYPLAVRPFYTMPLTGTAYSHSYDVILRGQEIASGSQRIHDHAMLVASLKDRNIDPSTLKDYVDSFRHGARPHGGFGLGLERIVTLYLDLENVREGSLYPRDPNRVVP